MYQKRKDQSIAGFTSQSSNAALPIVAMTTLKEDLKVKDEGADTVMPFSTTIGLSGCAGVQAGIILSFLWFSVIVPGSFSNWNVAILFINGIFVTLLASLGICAVVTSWRLRWIRIWWLLFTCLWDNWCIRWIIWYGKNGS
ncbi:cation:dicarboxylate symporter family transporter [Spiroplasma endosymbiont of Nebria brevicollis]|uniref:cation:dicarboxylate symporter family transporter n=1 Tax=Spiroplasma endosymbiont of Nebria brevicollis TaxID=3066284 RepID=UPI00313B64B3